MSNMTVFPLTENFCLAERQYNRSLIDTILHYISIIFIKLHVADYVVVVVVVVVAVGTTLLAISFNILET